MILRPSVWIVFSFKLDLGRERENGHDRNRMFLNDIVMINNIISFVILVLLFWGRSLHSKNRELHIKVMSFVIAADLLLVGYLALFNNALSKINGEMSGLLIVHLFFAITTVVLYLRLIPIGIKLAKGDESQRPSMKQMDRIIIVFRTMTFLTSMSLLLR
ncbi:MAG: hypothetical protein VX642_13890 [Bdellovibrionota bacterium]|nr:hypothetical protein [Bdellovibrionota bacterium]